MSSEQNFAIHLYMIDAIKNNYANIQNFILIDMNNI